MVKSNDPIHGPASELTEIVGREPSLKSVVPLAKGRRHRATYATDKRAGGYLIRVEGPEAAMFAGRVVPVTMRDGAEHDEKLVRLIWSGKDQLSGQPVALYRFESKPREHVEVPF